MSRSALELDEESALGAACEAVRRVVAARTTDPHLAEDVCQETMARLVARRERLEPAALLPYAVVTARNLLTARARERDRDRRHLHRLVDLRESEDPAHVTDRDDERRSVQAALRQLSDRDRSAILAQEVDGATVRELADAAGTSPGAFAVRMAEVRAKLRVDYVVAFRRAHLPTERCRSVLVALSAGDRRRQRLLAAGDHLLACGTCASLSEPLLQRERALAGWWLLALVPGGARWLWQAARGHPAQAATTLTVAAGVTGGALFLATRPEPVPATPEPVAAAPAPTPEPDRPDGPVEVDGRAIRSVSAEDLRAVAGRPVVVGDAAVLSVDADEGFWLGSGPGDRLWVKVLVGGESAMTVRAGQLVRFDGRLVAHPAGFAAAEGVERSEGGRQLDRQGHHIEVPAESLRARPA